MSAQNERINSIKEVQQLFEGVWPSLRDSLVQEYGDRLKMWPDVARPVRLSDDTVHVYPSTRRIGWFDHGVKTQVIFSRIGDEVTGIQVTSKDEETYLAPTIVRRTTRKEGESERYYVWKFDDGRLIEARVNPDDHNGVEYSGAPIARGRRRFNPWDMVRVVRGEGRRYYDLDPNIDRQFPPSLVGVRVLYGAAVPWRIDSANMAEEVIARSGVRAFPVDELRRALKS